ncbi:RNA polymerase sigma factor SigJ [Bacillus cytotoxicus]|uniref:RNA polymerase sigma factor SigJ n=1 Tax=Bacillus cytotoxicus TaxID=580165 RepID=A0ACC6A851_9BACI|nr:RNA polymerase sigma factor SigJ [Bacillus cytotoxicus]
MENAELSHLYIEHKPILFSLAYKMTGSIADAEDVIQDVFVKLNEYEMKHNKNVKAFLCKLVTNRCLDLLKASKKKRELYVGTWLPEPIAVIETDPLHVMMMKNDMSYVLLVLFEQLNPIERAIFILREILEYDYETIAEIVQKKAANCRKILSRIKKELPDLEKQSIVENVKGDREQVITCFINAIQQGNTTQVMEVLGEAIAYYADGGGRVTAATKPIYGAVRVQQLLIALATKYFTNQDECSMMQTDVNGSPGIVIRNRTGIQAVMSFEFEGNKIKSIYTILNPDKIKHFHINIDYTA